MTTTANSRSGEKGFTLVELSIVMIIIGLLIGGILKGQELIANARLAATVSKVKAIDAAINTFRDSYQGIPGDVLAARLPNCLAATKCGAVPSTGTQGDSKIGADNSADDALANTSENITAWAQLAATDLLGGVANAAAATNVIPSQTVPTAEVPGQIYIGYETGAVNLTGFGGPIGSVKAGHYLLIHNGASTTGAAASLAPNTAAAGTVVLTPSQAGRVDTKLDDGLPNSGSVLAMGTTALCTTAATTDATYRTASQAIACGVYVRIQQ